LQERLQKPVRFFVSDCLLSNGGAAILARELLLAFAFDFIHPTELRIAQRPERIERILEHDVSFPAGGGFSANIKKLVAAEPAKILLANPKALPQQRISSVGSDKEISVNEFAASDFKVPIRRAIAFARLIERVDFRRYLFSCLVEFRQSMVPLH